MIINMVERYNQITHLMLVKCNINVTHINKFITILPHTAITNLYLNMNNISDEGVKAIANILNVTQITSLFLNNCNITNVGGKHLLNVLNKNKLIKILDLSYNKLGDKFMFKLNETLKLNS